MNSGIRGTGRFIVDDAHLGNSEAAWADSPAIDSLSPLTIPLVDHVVVVAPHPDDEVLGAGGLLQIVARRRGQIEICAVTDGEASHHGVLADELRSMRVGESLTALRRLGLPENTRHMRLGYRDGQVAGREHQLADRLAAQLRPGSLCVAPWRGDGHPDHEACGTAAAMASRAAGVPLFEYLVWAWHWADPLGTDVPWSACFRLNLDRRQTARKRWAITAFGSQIRPFGPDLGISPVLPAPVLRRFWRPFEVYVT